MANTNESNKSVRKPGSSSEQNKQQRDSQKRDSSKNQSTQRGSRRQQSSS